MWVDEQPKVPRIEPSEDKKGVLESLESKPRKKENDH